VTTDTAAMGESSEDSEDLPQLLRRALAEHPDLSQKKLAERSGIPLTTLNSWVKGRRGVGGNINSESLRRLADQLPDEYTPRRVFLAAGRPVPGPQSQAREETLMQRYRKLTEPQQQALIDIADILRRVQ
jgi:transcriptional regulator with XRE-family HTH domain